MKGKVLVSMCEKHHEQIANQIEAVCGDCDDCCDDWTREWFDVHSADPEIQCIGIMLEAFDRRQFSGRQIERIANYLSSKAKQMIAELESSDEG